MCLFLLFVELFLLSVEFLLVFSILSVVEVIRSPLITFFLLVIEIAGIPSCSEFLFEVPSLSIEFFRIPILRIILVIVVLLLMLLVRIVVGVARVSIAFVTLSIVSVGSLLFGTRLIII